MVVVSIQLGILFTVDLSIDAMDVSGEQQVLIMLYVYVCAYMCMSGYVCMSVGTCVCLLCTCVCI